jgi:RNA polymerase sigma factor (sigma-70 family)
VYGHAQRELRILELEETIPKGDWTASDIVDDVLLRACERYSERPTDLSFDVWLIQLLSERLAELGQDLKPVTLVAATAATTEIDSGGDCGDADDWREGLLKPESPLSVEELLQDERHSDFWDALSADEQQERLTQLLRKLPTHERQALMLHVAYGFEPEEIARVLGRTQDTVSADIQTAREKLQRQIR